MQTPRFKPGDQVRTPRGHVGTVHANLSNGQREVDVEITSVDRFFEAELSFADPGAHAQLGELQDAREEFLTQRNNAEKRAALAEGEVAALKAQVADLERRLSRPKKKSTKHRR